MGGPFQHLATDRGASPHTVRNYGEALKDFLNWHHAERRTAPASAQLERDDFRVPSPPRTTPAGTRFNAPGLQCAAHLYKFLIRHGQAGTSPLTNLSLPNGKTIAPFLTAAQMVALLNAPLQPLTQPKRNAPPGGRPWRLPAIGTRPFGKRSIPAACASANCAACGRRIWIGLRATRPRPGEGAAGTPVPIGAPALKAIENYCA